MSLLLSQMNPLITTQYSTSKLNGTMTHKPEHSLGWAGQNVLTCQVCPAVCLCIQGLWHTGDHKTAGSRSCNFSWNVEGPLLHLI
jgi:hypothetical protein